MRNQTPKWAPKDPKWEYRIKNPKKNETVEGQFEDGLSQLDDKVLKVGNRTDKLENKVFSETIVLCNNA
jgi:hypothetical protein